MLESRLVYQDRDIEIWTSVDPEIFRNPEDRRIRKITALSSYPILVRSDGNYDETSLEETAFCLAEEEAGTFFRFYVEDTIFYKPTGDYVRGDCPSEYLMRVGNLRRLCDQLRINPQRGLPGEGAVLIVFDPRRGYSIPIDFGL